MKHLLILVFVFAVTAVSARFPNGTTVVPVAMPDAVANTNAGKLSQSLAVLQSLLGSHAKGSGILAYTQQLRPIEMYYFPGKSDENALIVGGVHGSELSSIAVAQQLIQQLQTGDTPYYNVIVIPVLFPDNKAAAERVPAEIGSVKNIGRYTGENFADPNRQMPLLGTGFDALHPIDKAGREIELENQVLLQLIQVWKPVRIASLHAIRNPQSAGIYADPRTDCNSVALGFDADSSLAVKMAELIALKGGTVPGNKLQSGATALYHCDPAVAKKGEKQLRNTHGSHLPGNRGYGISLGSWASTAVCDANGENRREAAMLITVEFPGNKRPQDYTGKEEERCLQQLHAYAAGIAGIFLQKGNN